MHHGSLHCEKLAFVQLEILISIFIRHGCSQNYTRAHKCSQYFECSFIGIFYRINLCIYLCAMISYIRRLYIYIYIYCHPQTDSFVVSQLFIMARHVGRLKLGSKPAKLYLRHIQKNCNKIQCIYIYIYIYIYIRLSQILFFYIRLLRRLLRKQRNILRRARKLRRVLETWGDLLLPTVKWESIS